MAYFNKIIMVGNLTRDPESKEVGSSLLTNFTLATNRKFKEQEEVCFTQVQAWGKLAEVCENHLKKGSGVLVEGRLKLETWEKDGKKNSKHVIVADLVKFLGKKSDQ